MTAVGSAPLAVSRSPSGARARAVVSETWAKDAPEILSSGRHSGRVRGKLARATLAVGANEFALIGLR